MGLLAHNLDYCEIDNLKKPLSPICMVDYRKDNLDYCDYCAAFGARLRLTQIISSGRCRTGP